MYLTYRGRWSTDAEEMKYRLRNASYTGDLGVALLLNAVPEEVQRFDWNIATAELELDKKLSAGAAGQVWLGRFKGSKVAIKEIFSTILAVQDETAMQDFYNETKILRGLSHPNVITFYGVAADQEHCYIVMELMQKSLAEVLANRTATLGMQMQFLLENILDIGAQVASGMAYMHSRNIIHYDLKPQNIMLTMASGFNCKICDFGTSKLKHSSIEMTRGGNAKSPRSSTSSYPLQGFIEDDDAEEAAFGTMLYMPPEVLPIYRSTMGIQGGQDVESLMFTHTPSVESDKAYDVFSFSIVLWELLNLEELYDYMKNDAGCMKQP